MPGAGSPGLGHAGDHREIDVDARRGLVLVLELGLRQCGAVVHAPVDRLELTEDVPASEQVGQHVENSGLVAVVKREVRVVPIARDAEAAELVARGGRPT